MLIEVLEENASGCKTIYLNPQSITPYIKASPKIYIDVVEPLCENINRELQLTANETTGIPGIGKFYGQGISAEGVFNPSKLGATQTSVQYTFTSTEGCESNANYPLTILEAPEPTSSTEISACVGTEIELKAGNGQQFKWMPSNGLSDAHIRNPRLTVTGNAVYVVTATNTNGCYVMDTLSIKTITDSKNSFSIPSAFSPNGDGKNDCFGLQHWGNVKINEFSIYNRWGQVVFTTKDPARCWDGTINGKKQAAETFVYKISAVSSCGEIQRHGTVTIVN